MHLETRSVANHKMRWEKCQLPYQMLEYLSEYSKLRPSMIHWGAKQHPLPQLRWAMMVALRKHFGWKLTRIAAFFEMDHTTVMHGIDKGLAKAKAEPEYQALIDGLVEAVS